MKRPQMISPGSLNRMLQAANEAWKRRDLQQGLELLERASRLDPANPGILLQLGRYRAQCYEFAEAENCFEQAVRVAPNKAEMLAAAGRHAADMGNPPMAERFLQRAVQQTKVAPDTVARLAELYERLHRAEDAAALAERALGMDNTCPLARLTQARLHRRAGRLAEAEQALRPALMAASPEWRVRSYYELGAIYDRQGRYDDAMSAVLEAKALLRPHVSPSLVRASNALFRSLEDVQSDVSADLLARWSDSTQELLQPRRLALLAGHPRSGTTLLEQVLDAHSDITSADETGIFYDNAYRPLQQSLPPGTAVLAGLETATLQTLRRARKRYFQTMSRCVGLRPGACGPEGRPWEHRLLIDKNPNVQPFILNFVRFFPEARLIVALRDPRDVVLSCFMQCCFPLGTMNCTSLSLEDTATAYSRVMGIWRAVKSLLENPWLEVRYEDMVEDLESVARRTLDFLGVSWDEQVLGFAEHARKKFVRSPTYADVTRPVYKRARGRWRHYQKYLEPHLPIVEPLVKAFGYE